jgi:predicted nucleotidyltransferase
MIERLKAALETEQRLAYVILFGSRARGTEQAGSDLDLAVAYAHGFEPLPLEIGGLVSRLESATGARVDVVLIDEAAPGLAYRVFRDGRELLVRDRPALVRRKARAILEYLDFSPVEEMIAQGVLAAARRGR